MNGILVTHDKELNALYNDKSSRDGRTTEQHTVSSSNLGQLDESVS